MPVGLLGTRGTFGLAEANDVAINSLRSTHATGHKMKAFGTIVFAGCCLFGMACGGAAMYYQVRAARHRKPGIAFTSALSTVNVLASPEL